MPTINPKRRHKARLFAMQALYQWHFSKGEIHEVQAQFITENSHVKADWIFFKALIEGVLKNLSALDEAIAIQTDHGIENANPVEVATLRLAAFELARRIDVPYRVVINEYVALAKEFGAAEGHTFVNGVLDNLAKQYRKVELGIS